MKVALYIGNWQLHGYAAFGHAKLTAMICFTHSNDLLPWPPNYNCQGYNPNLKQYLLIN